MSEITFLIHPCFSAPPGQLWPRRISTVIKNGN